MKYNDFYDNVNNHPLLEGFGIDHESKKFLVKNKERDCKFDVGFKAIEKYAWEDLRSVLLCEREPIVLDHMTRIVGYFSKTSNWNASKIAEQRDRQRGNYKL